MNHADICHREASQLVIVDVQEKLCSAMAPDRLAALIKNCSTLLHAAQLLDVPRIFTEQYPQGLGPTRSDFSSWVTPENKIEKIAFSCCEESEFCARMDDTRPQVVLAGMETHVCVLQTALQLQEMHHRVYVVEDAVISRDPDNKANALARLRQAGIIITNTESVIFEWLKTAEGDAFKTLSKLIR